MCTAIWQCLPDRPQVGQVVALVHSSLVPSCVCMPPVAARRLGCIRGSVSHSFLVTWSWNWAAVWRQAACVWPRPGRLESLQRTARPAPAASPYQCCRRLPTRVDGQRRRPLPNWRDHTRCSGELRPACVAPQGPQVALPARLVAPRLFGRPGVCQTVWVAKTGSIKWLPWLCPRAGHCRASLEHRPSGAATGHWPMLGPSIFAWFSHEVSCARMQSAQGTSHHTVRVCPLASACSCNPSQGALFTT